MMNIQHPNKRTDKENRFIENRYLLCKIYVINNVQDVKKSKFLNRVQLI